MMEMVKTPDLDTDRASSSIVPNNRFSHAKPYKSEISIKSDAISDPGSWRLRAAPVEK